MGKIKINKVKSQFKDSKLQIESWDLGCGQMGIRITEGELVKASIVIDENKFDSLKN